MEEGKQQQHHQHQPRLPSQHRPSTPPSHPHLLILILESLNNAVMTKHPRSLCMFPTTSSHAPNKLMLHSTLHHLEHTTIASGITSHATTLITHTSKTTPDANHPAFAKEEQGHTDTQRLFNKSARRCLRHGPRDDTQVMHLNWLDRHCVTSSGEPKAQLPIPRLSVNCFLVASSASHLV